MITKDSIFAQGGQQDTSQGDADFRVGYIPNTTAMAESVNRFGSMSDRQLWVVCHELVNLLSLYGITPDNVDVQTDPNDPSASQNQLATLFSTKIKQPATLTGIIQADYTSAPTQSGNSISFPQMKISYNNAVYYGDTQQQMRTVTLSAQTLSANNSWTDGVWYIYASAPVGSTTATLNKQSSPVAGADGATKCMLGSVYVYNGAFQSDTWKFQPWLTISTVGERESPVATTKGGFISAVSGTTVQMGALEIMAEGINFDTDMYTPSILTVSAANPFTFKNMYPGYNPGSSSVSALDTTHIYNITNNSWDTLTADADHPKYMVLVPCITPAGQTLIIAPQSRKSGSTYNQLFDSVDDAQRAIYGLEYVLNGIAARCIYLGQSLIVKVGATDLTSSENFVVVGMLPQTLSGFTSASGQTGGAAESVYTPMKLKDMTNYTSVTAENNTGYIIGASQSVTVTPPTVKAGVINQFELQYAHSASRAGFTITGASWWGSDQPDLTNGKTYLIICEYVNGSWRAGYLES